MYKLILADGTELSVGLCGSYGGPFYIEVYDSDFVECSSIFSDTAKTSVMIYDYHAGQNTYEGYTQLTGLELAQGMINVTMRRPEA